MKLPSSLVKGLSEQQIKDLESQMRGVLVRQLKDWLKKEIKNAEIKEEDLSFEVTQLASLVGERRGYRRVLNLLPEE